MTASKHTTPIIIPPLDSNIAQETETIGSTVVSTGNAVTVDLGTTIKLDDGGEAVWCQMASAVPAFNAVVVASNFRASNLTTTNVAKGQGGISSQVGWAQTSIAVSNQGWIHTSGRPIAQLAANIGEQNLLFTTATAGFLDDATVSAAMVSGAKPKIGATSVSNATARTIIVPVGAMILPLGGTT
jgi:hypothetical protein